ncbi:copper resistance CopC family protein [Citricoccus sp. NR2]|uniref:copper resistance CopC family protein n=1 Tax=Citricoccus sp. NR2 TaxID=3004095 RepID=UPI0022DD3A58|nr:copper resistance CopC family protein [Citricoccus sp. NR2]WBL20371.1 copper resistance protein CopC [Citricoccus sp. NR2]
MNTLFRTTGTAAALGTALLLATATTALAHDELLESTPARGETLTTTPEDVVLTFSGAPLDGEGLSNLIDITDAEGNSWTSGEVTIDGYDLTTDTCAGMPNGDYTLGYRVVYSDGHVGEESFSFTLDDPEAPSAEEVVAPEAGCEAAEPSDSASAVESAEPADTDESVDAAEVAPAVPGWIWIAVLVAVVVMAIGAVWVIRTVRQHDGASTNGSGPEQG